MLSRSENQPTRHARRDLEIRYVTKAARAAVMIMLSNKRTLKLDDSAFLRSACRRLNSFVRSATSGFPLTREISRSSIARTTATFRVKALRGCRIQQKEKARGSDSSSSIELLIDLTSLKSDLA